MDPAVAEPVAEPCTGDQRYEVRDGVADDDQLEAGAVGVQVGTDRGAATFARKPRKTSNSAVNWAASTTASSRRDRLSVPWSLLAAGVGTGGRGAGSGLVRGVVVRRNCCGGNEKIPPLGDGIFSSRSLTTAQSVDQWS